MTHSFKKTELFLLYLLVFLTPFLFSWKTKELFEFNKMLFVYVMAILIMANYLWQFLSDRKLTIVSSLFLPSLLLFVLSQLLSTVFSIHIYTSLFGYYSRFHGGLFSTLAYVSLYFVATQTLQRKHITYFLLTILLAGFFSSLYAIPEHFGHSFSCLLMQGHFEVSCWKQDVQNRIFGTFGQPNWLAAYAVTILPLAPAFLGQVKKSQSFLSQNWQTGIASSAAVLLFLTLLFSKSRSGFLACLLGLGFFLGCYNFLLFRRHKKQALSWWNASSKKVFSLFVLLIFFALGFGTPYSPSITKLARENKPVENELPSPVAEQNLDITDSGDIRLIVWRGALKVWQRYPILGSGVETFAYSYFKDRPVEHNQVSEWDFLYNKAHNEFLNFLATTGLVGLLSYSLIIVSVIFFSLRFILRSQADPDTQLLVLALLSGYLALALSNFFGFSTVSVGLLFFLYPAFISILILSESKQKQIKSTGNRLIIHLRSYSPTRYALRAAILILTGFLLLGVLSLWLSDFYYARSLDLQQSGYLSDALDNLGIAAALNPNNAELYNQLSLVSAQAALSLAQNPEETEATQQFLVQSVAASDLALTLNPVQTTFYKSRITTLLSLSTLEPNLLPAAQASSQELRYLAPTDPKAWYYAAVVELNLDHAEKSQELVEYALQLKNDYYQARLHLAQLLELEDKLPAALEQYRILANQLPTDTGLQEKVSVLEASVSAESN